MKRILLFLMTLCLVSTLTACGASSSGSGTTKASENQVEMEKKKTTGSGAKQERKLVLRVQGQDVHITLYDTPTARALYEKLPMELSFSDFNGTEKIAYPPEKLPTAGEPDGCDPEVGDLCLYDPWGNLCIFYQDFRYSKSLIKLGHVDSGMEILTKQSRDFKAVLEKQ